jgi:hypothetical protein
VRGKEALFLLKLKRCKKYKHPRNNKAPAFLQGLCFVWYGTLAQGNDQADRLRQGSYERGGVAAVGTLVKVASITSL